MAPPDISVLRKQRGAIKASCTRINTYADSITALTPDVLAQIEERKSRLDEFWADYGKIQTQIEMLDEGDVDRENFENAYYTLSAKLRTILTPHSTNRASMLHSSSITNRSDAFDPATHVRLPKLDLPSFTGKYDDWMPFSNMFKSIIDNNPSLSITQKFQYLRGAVTGDAASIIQSIELSDANYEEAWNLLRARYDNTRAIVYTHIREILDLPIMSKENLLELRKIADNTAKHVRALISLKRPADKWDDILICILVSKLDPITAREWQHSLKDSSLPALKQFLEFITQRCQALEVTQKIPATPATQASASSRLNSKRPSSVHTATVNAKCAYCNGDHPIYYCKDFLRLSVDQRIKEIRKRKLCGNCLRANHTSSQCNSRSCQTCNAKHNTLLHLEQAKNTSKDVTTSRSNSYEPASQSTVSTHSSVRSRNDNIMLSTAVVHVYDRHGSTKNCRALLDCGSQANFITRNFLQTLRLKSQPLNISINGINQTSSTANQITTVTIQSRHNSFSATIECIVTDRITGNLPAITINRDALLIPHNIRLADPQFHISSEIDLLIGADLFWQLLCIGQIKATANCPMIHKTRLGWVLAGRYATNIASSKLVNTLHASISNADLQNQLKEFWQLEEAQGKCDNSQSLDERNCTEHFIKNVTRDQNGRFIVKLPIKQDVLNSIGDSRSTALRRFYSVERRLNRDPKLKYQYTQFMAEYSELGHAQLVREPTDTAETPSYYLPHHPVMKESSETTKLRVVFDGSCKGSLGNSLNDALLIGPVLQQNLISIIIRFRTLRYVFCADIVKMYRQISIHESQWHLQRIFWRADPSERVSVYELTTVTYGTSSASFLATRCLTYLAELEAHNFPTGSKHVINDFYVDDCLSGADSLIQAKLIRDEIIGLLNKGSFKLSKWASNSPELLDVNQPNATKIIEFNKSCESRVLGIRWNPVSDSFHFHVIQESRSNSSTKRTILSEIARLFDPLGLVGPVVMLGKLIIQELWRLNLNWDESIPTHLHTMWSRIKEQLTALNDLRIPRLTKFTTNFERLQVHGFCDASQIAYGACIYLRSEIDDGAYRVELLCSRSRVAPLKTISLPRLELCAALLLSQLYEQVRASIDISQMHTFLWSDSIITLHWISSHSRKWSVFIANRVGQIQRITNINDWRHVSSKNNPADILSRGAEPQTLRDSSLWWHGPEFLRNCEASWPVSKPHLPEAEIPERLKNVTVAVATQDSTINKLLRDFSDLNKICRIIAYCFRISNSSKIKYNITSKLISSREIQAALLAVCKFVQNEVFSREIKALQTNGAVEATSSMLALSPFLSTDSLIRAGGRLKNSQLPYSTRHPIILPKQHRLTHLIIEFEHIRSLHAGVQGTIAAVRQRFWPLSLRSTTRHIIRKCVVCFKVKPTLSEAIMGDLPADRVKPSRPFSYSGVDYAGPIFIREGKRRNARNIKAYMAVFVCFATKAVHLELVGDLTTESFLGALKRFMSRRGKVIKMYSDNGTAFVGAARELKEFYEFLSRDDIQSEIKKFLLESHTTWEFIPPNAPHFGGLWEAAVKSAKHHMYRIIGNAHLTYEEMSTLLCEIEAILNSRPITPLSADPSDINCLTPGHFLIGEELSSFPRLDLTDTNEGRLSRWQRVEQLRQHFWKRWSVEYLSQLQQKSKWMYNKGVQLQIGQLVLIKQQGLAPLLWMMGRIQDVHSGADGVARSAIVKTSRGLLTRPLSKLCILPIEG